MIFLWSCFIVGAWLHILSKAFTKVHGPDQSINSYPAYFGYYWPVLLFRAGVGGALYWATFDPDFFANLLRLAGWSSLSIFPALFPHSAKVAFMVGLSIDSVLDTIAQHVAYFQNFLPPMTLVNPNLARR